MKDTSVKTENSRPVRKPVIAILIIISAIIIFLVFEIVTETGTFDDLLDVTETYIELQEEAGSLMDASDYLTEEAQCYTVLGERAHMDNYFMEAGETRRREHAVEVMEKRMPDSEALNGLKSAMKESLSLMDREYYAMKLVLLAQGDEDIPEAMDDVVISPDDLSLSSEEKMELARTMMHDEGYYEQKNRIRDHMGLCIEELKTETYKAQYTAQTKIRREMLGMSALIFLLILAAVVLIFVSAGPENRSGKRNNKGLTMAELLIVLAIIAVLTATAVVVFSRQLEKSREAYDIYTMRQAASAAVEKFYMGVSDSKSAAAAGMLWDNNGGDNVNAYGVYSPSGTIRAESSGSTKQKPYGKGTKKDGGTQFFMGNENGAYVPKEDYRNAVVMVSIYPKKKYAMVYWKNVKGSDAKKYVGGTGITNNPKYSIRIDFE